MTGEDMSALETTMQKLEITLQPFLDAVNENGACLSVLQEKTRHMELRSNFTGHDAAFVMQRQVVNELATMVAKKKQVQHEFVVKMNMLEPVLKNDMQLECAMKTKQLKAWHLDYALKQMKLVHKLQMTEVNRIGSEKPGDLCESLQRNGWLKKFQDAGDTRVQSIVEGCVNNMKLARLQVILALKHANEEWTHSQAQTNEDKKKVKEASEYSSNIEKLQKIF